MLTIATAASGIDTVSISPLPSIILGSPCSLLGRVDGGGFGIRHPRDLWKGSCLGVQGLTSGQFLHGCLVGDEH